MDYRIEQWINGPAGHHATLDTVMKDAANWAVPVFIGIVAVWFVGGFNRSSPLLAGNAYTDRVRNHAPDPSTGGVLILNSRVHRNG